MPGDLRAAGRTDGGTGDGIVAVHGRSHDRADRRRRPNGAAVTGASTRDRAERLDSGTLTQIGSDDGTAQPGDDRYRLASTFGPNERHRTTGRRSSVAIELAAACGRTPLLLSNKRPSIASTVWLQCRERRSESGRPDMGGSVEAAPIHGQNTQTLVLQCAADTVRVVIKPNSGASGWDVDAQSQLTGI
jgi:hypothetical protein